MKAKKIIYSVFVWILCLAITFIFATLYIIVWLLTALFDKKLWLLNYTATIWGSALTVLIPGWNVKVIGREKLKTGNKKIIVVNHQSMEDILVLFRLGLPFLWISKAEVFKIPIYGWFMYLKGDIKLHRSSKSSIKKMLSDAEKALNKGCSLTIFPEGTRSKTGEIGNFKDGAFKLAKKTKTPVIPVVITGTGKPLIHSGFLFRGKHKISMKILDEIPYSRFENMEINDFSNMVKSIMKEELNKLKQEESRDGSH